MQTYWCLLVLASLSAVAQTTPQTTPDVTRPEQTPLSAPSVSGALNFREIGGIKTQDGRAVRGRLIFRSGELSHLTASDYQQLAPYKIRYIFDLRTQAERTSAATHWAGIEPVVVPLPLGCPAGQDPADAMKCMFAKGTDSAHVGEAMRNVTATIAVEGAPSIGNILRDLASGDEPAIIHCTAGKDRTGVVIAVLLRTLGVPLDAVSDDYLRSNDAVPAQMVRMKAAMATGSNNSPAAIPNIPADSMRVLMGVDRSYLDAAFAAIDARYGSFDAYVREGLMLTPSDVEALRARLLEPAR